MQTVIKNLLLIFSVVLWLNPASGQTQDKSQTDTSTALRQVGIPLEIQQACEEQRYQIAWSLNQLDSNDLPKQLYFKGYRYDEGDNSKINYRTQLLDSQALYELPYLWIGSPGYYWLEYTDSSQGIHYSSDEVHIELCSRFQLPDKYVIEPGKYLRPVYSQNIDQIELVIFDAQGTEVFTTNNPNFKWDGRNASTGESCATGSYFYHCDVYENRGGVRTKKNITGIIEIVH